MELEDILLDLLYLRLPKPPGRDHHGDSGDTDGALDDEEQLVAWRWSVCLPLALFGVCGSLTLILLMFLKKLDEFSDTDMDSTIQTTRDKDLANGDAWTIGSQWEDRAQSYLMSPPPPPPPSLRSCFQPRFEASGAIPPTMQQQQRSPLEGEQTVTFRHYGNLSPQELMAPKFWCHWSCPTGQSDNQAGCLDQQQQQQQDLQDQQRQQKDLPRQIHSVEALQQTETKEADDTSKPRSCESKKHQKKTQLPVSSPTILLKHGGAHLPVSNREREGQEADAVQISTLNDRQEKTRVLPATAEQLGDSNQDGQKKENQGGDGGERKNQPATPGQLIAAQAEVIAVGPGKVEPVTIDNFTEVTCLDATAKAHKSSTSSRSNRSSVGTAMARYCKTNANADEKTSRASKKRLRVQIGKAQVKDDTNTGTLKIRSLSQKSLKTKMDKNRPRQNKNVTGVAALTSQTFEKAVAEINTLANTLSHNIHNGPSPNAKIKRKCLATAKHGHGDEGQANRLHQHECSTDIPVQYVSGCKSLHTQTKPSSYKCRFEEVLDASYFKQEVHKSLKGNKTDDSHNFESQEMKKNPSLVPKKSNSCSSKGSNYPYSCRNLPVESYFRGPGRARRLVVTDKVYRNGVSQHRFGKVRTNKALLSLNNSQTKEQNVFCEPIRHCYEKANLNSQQFAFSTSQEKNPPTNEQNRTDVRNPFIAEHQNGQNMITGNARLGSNNSMTFGNQYDRAQPIYLSRLSRSECLIQQMMLPDNFVGSIPLCEVLFELMSKSTAEYKRLYAGKSSFSHVNLHGGGALRQRVTAFRYHPFKLNRIHPYFKNRSTIAHLETEAFRRKPKTTDQFVGGKGTNKKNFESKLIPCDYKNGVSLCENQTAGLKVTSHGLQSGLSQETCPNFRSVHTREVVNRLDRLHAPQPKYGHIVLTESPYLGGINHHGGHKKTDENYLGINGQNRSSTVGTPIVSLARGRKHPAEATMTASAANACPENGSATRMLASRADSDTSRSRLLPMRPEMRSSGVGNLRYPKSEATRNRTPSSKLAIHVDKPKSRPGFALSSPSVCVSASRTGRPENRYGWSGLSDSDNESLFQVSDGLGTESNISTSPASGSPCGTSALCNGFSMHKEKKSWIHPKSRSTTDYLAHLNFGTQNYAPRSGVGHKHRINRWKSRAARPILNTVPSSQRQWNRTMNRLPLVSVDETPHMFSYDPNHVVGSIRTSGDNWRENKREDNSVSRATLQFCQNVRNGRMSTALMERGDGGHSNRLDKSNIFTTPLPNFTSYVLDSTSESKVTPSLGFVSRIVDAHAHKLYSHKHLTKNADVESSVKNTACDTKERLEGFEKNSPCFQSAKMEQGKKDSLVHVGCAGVRSTSEKIQEASIPWVSASNMASNPSSSGARLSMPGESRAAQNSVYSSTSPETGRDTKRSESLSFMLSKCSIPCEESQHLSSTKRSGFSFTPRKGRISSEETEGGGSTKSGTFGGGQCVKFSIPRKTSNRAMHFSEISKHQRTSNTSKRSRSPSTPGSTITRNVTTSHESSRPTCGLVTTDAERNLQSSPISQSSRSYRYPRSDSYHGAVPSPATLYSHGREVFTGKQHPSSTQQVTISTTAASPDRRDKTRSLRGGTIFPRKADSPIAGQRPQSSHSRATLNSLKTFLCSNTPASSGGFRSVATSRSSPRQRCQNTRFSSPTTKASSCSSPTPQRILRRLEARKKSPKAVTEKKITRIDKRPGLSGRLLPKAEGHSDAFPENVTHKTNSGKEQSRTLVNSNGHVQTLKDSTKQCVSRLTNVTGQNSTKVASHVKVGGVNLKSRFNGLRDSEKKAEPIDKTGQRNFQNKLRNPRLYPRSKVNDPPRVAERQFTCNRSGMRDKLKAANDPAPYSKVNSKGFPSNTENKTVSIARHPQEKPDHRSSLAGPNQRINNYHVNQHVNNISFQNEKTRPNRPETKLTPRGEHPKTYNRQAQLHRQNQVISQRCGHLAEQKEPSYHGSGVQKTGHLKQPAPNVQRAQRKQRENQLHVREESKRRVEPQMSLKSMASISGLFHLSPSPARGSWFKCSPTSSSPLTSHLTYNKSPSRLDGSQKTGLSSDTSQSNTFVRRNFFAAFNSNSEATAAKSRPTEPGTTTVELDISQLTTLREKDQSEILNSSNECYRTSPSQKVSPNVIVSKPSLVYHHKRHVAYPEALTKEQSLKCQTKAKPQDQTYRPQRKPRNIVPLKQGKKLQEDTNKIATSETDTQGHTKQVQSIAKLPKASNANKEVSKTMLKHKGGHSFLYKSRERQVTSPRSLLTSQALSTNNSAKVIRKGVGKRWCRLKFSNRLLVLKLPREQARRHSRQLHSDTTPLVHEPGANVVWMSGSSGEGDSCSTNQSFSNGCAHNDRVIFGQDDNTAEPSQPLTNALDTLNDSSFDWYKPAARTEHRQRAISTEQPPALIPETDSELPDARLALPFSSPKSASTFSNMQANDQDGQHCQPQTNPRPHLADVLQHANPSTSTGERVGQFTETLLRSSRESNVSSQEHRQSGKPLSCSDPSKARLGLVGQTLFLRGDELSQSGQNKPAQAVPVTDTHDKSVQMEPSTHFTFSLCLENGILQYGRAADIGVVIVDESLEDDSTVSSHLSMDNIELPELVECPLGIRWSRHKTDHGLERVIVSSVPKCTQDGGPEKWANENQNEARDEQVFERNENADDKKKQK